ncbi:hypothetical protein MMPV_002741 [Pyropia vietnamensis]
MACHCSPPPARRRPRSRLGWRLPAAAAAAATAAAAAVSTSATVAAAAVIPERRGAWLPTFSGGTAAQVVAVRHALRLLGTTILPVPEDVHLLVTFKSLEGQALAHTRGVSFRELVVPAASTQTKNDPPDDADDATDGDATPPASILVRFPAIAATMVRARYPEAQVQPAGGGALPNPPPPLLVGANSGGYDMRMDIDSGVDWYTGTDGRPPANVWDLITVTLHEALHGALFSGGIRYLPASTGTPARALFRLGSAPTRFDTFLSTPAGCAVSEYVAAGDTDGEEDLAAALTNNALYFTSDGIRLRLHAPAIYSVDSSVYHLSQPSTVTTSEEGFRPTLMQPQLPPGVAIHQPDRATAAVMTAVLSLSAPPAKICDELPSPAEVAAAEVPLGDTFGDGDGGRPSSGVPIDGGGDFGGGRTIFGLPVAAFAGIASAAGVLLVAVVTAFVLLCGRDRNIPGSGGCAGAGAVKVGGDHGGGAEARSRRRRAAREAAAAGRGNPLRPPRAAGRGDDCGRGSANMSGVDTDDVDDLATALAAWSAAGGVGRRADSGGSTSTAVTDSTRTSSGGSVEAGESGAWGVVSAPLPAYLVAGRGRAVISRVDSALEWASDGGSDEEGEREPPTRPPG